MAPKRERCPTHLLRFAAVLASLLAFSCSLLDRKPAIIWTDTPEMLIAVEMFNASRSYALMEVHYVDDLAETLRKVPEVGATGPSLVIGKGLRTKALGNYFQSAESLLGKLLIPKNAFYPALLEGGRIGGKQVLIPTSFNLILILSGKEEARQSGLAELDVPPSEKSSITMEEIQRRAVLYNGNSKETGERMGFSPRWPDKDFLFQWMQLNGAGFGETRSKRERKSSRGETFPLYWDPAGLENAVGMLRDYVRDVNASVDAEDAFAFKYLFAPGYKNVETGKVLFAAMNSADYFTLAPVARSRYDYRYFSEKGRLAVSEDIKYAGIPRKAPNKDTAEQFLHWFLDPEHQKAILERSRSLRLSESAFGIGGGFSSIQPVTETLFPSYYTDLLAHAPQGGMVIPPEPLPTSWKRIKEELILPWLDENAGKELKTPADADFSAHLEAYLDKNPDLRSGNLR